MTNVAHIVSSSLGIPKHSTFHIVHLLMKLVLGRQLMALWICRVGILGCTLDVLTDIERAFAGILVPPGDKRLVVGSTITYLPI